MFLTPWPVTGHIATVNSLSCLSSYRLSVLLLFWCCNSRKTEETIHWQNWTVSTAKTFCHSEGSLRASSPRRSVVMVTWDQAQFSFRFVITFRRAKRNENRARYKPSTKRLPPTFLIDWHLPNQPTKITSVACFSSMQIFQAWEKCRLGDLKNGFYFLIFSAKNKTVSTITFNFLRG